MPSSQLEVFVQTWSITSRVMASESGSPFEFAKAFSNSSRGIATVGSASICVVNSSARVEVIYETLPVKNFL